MRRLFFFFLCSALVFSGLLIIWGIRVVYQLPTFKQVQKNYGFSDVTILDRNGFILQETRIRKDVRKLHWYPLQEIASIVQKTVLFAEDKRFFQHHGVDFFALVSSVVIGLTRRGFLRGGSTITMQLVKLLDEMHQRKHGRRSLSGKLRQISLAWLLETKWEKNEILEAYLNLASFRGELQGIHATAKGLFGKDPSVLGEKEAVLLSVLLRSPSSEVPKIAQRSEDLWKVQHPSDTEESTIPIKTFVESSLSKPYQLSSPTQLAFHASKLLLKVRPTTSTVISTLDRDLQEEAFRVVARQLEDLKQQNVHDASLLVVEHHSGEVLTYIGNRGAKAPYPHVDGVQALRQVGSTLKPFLYAQALEKKWLTAASLLSDTPLEVALQQGSYRPSNFDFHFRGLVSLRLALAGSLNIPAVRTLMLVGEERFISFLTDLGITHLNQADYYGPSLALGSADLNLWEMVQAYAVLANKGVKVPLHLANEKKESVSNRVLSEDSAFILADILSDRQARADSFGLENPLSTRFWSAAKTGTSKDMRDNWCLGYSDRYTVGVWVGNFSGEPMWHVSGVSGAAPIWLEMMHYLHRYTPSRSWTVPEGVVEHLVGFNGLEDERQEFFIRGTESPQSLPPKENLRSFIRYPKDGLQIALDPDIPKDSQILFFQAEAAPASFLWELNGEKIANTDSVVPWSLRSGSYHLRLLTLQGKELDKVHFVVKGL